MGPGRAGGAREGIGGGVADLVEGGGGGAGNVVTIMVENLWSPPVYTVQYVPSPPPPSSAGHPSAPGGLIQKILLHLQLQ